MVQGAVASTLGKGTHFTLRIPRITPQESLHELPQPQLPVASQLAGV